MVSAIDYYVSMYDTSLVTAKEEIELANLIKKGDKAAERKLFGANLRLVFSFAKKLSGQKKWLLDDLVQSGVIGLAKAVDFFDVTRGNKFSTYATSEIGYEMFDCLKTSKAIKLAETSQRQVNRLIRIFYGDDNTYDNMYADSFLSWVAGEFNKRFSKKDKKIYTTNDIHNIVKDYRLLCVDSLDNLQYEDGGMSLLDYLKDKSVKNPEYVVSCIWESRDINAIITRACLNNKEKDVVIRLFGLNGVHPGTYQSVGQELGLKSWKVKQLQDISFRKLRYALQQIKNI